MNLIVLLILFGCTSEWRGQFIKIECTPSDAPKYDYRATSKEILTPELDSLLRIVKRRDVFKPCRELTYLATFVNNDGELITKSRIRFIPSGKRWAYQPEKQDEIIVQYEFTKADFERNKKYQLNESLPTDQWTSVVKTGIIENVEEIWMHPFRDNQYNFTEVAPFPQVQLPMEIGKAWKEQISPKGGYGDWSNKTIISDFQVVLKESIIVPYGKINDCWKISARSIFDLGESHLEYWFNEKLGFVKFIYVNYGKQKLTIELQLVENK